MINKINKRTAVYLIACLTLSVVAGALQACEGAKPQKSYSSLQDFLSQLKQAVDAKDERFVLDRVAQDFMIYRDFGGMYNENSSHIENFNAVFPFDNSKLMPEYKDWGWQELASLIEIDAFQNSPYSKTETCGQIDYDENDFPSTVLCFRQTNNTAWSISSIIYGGD